MKRIFILAMGIIFISTIYAGTAASKGFNPKKKPVTTSEQFTLDAGQSELSRAVEIPNCGLNGFVVDSVVVSPGVWYSGTAYEDDPGLGLWSVNVNLWQRSETVDMSVPLCLYGNGYETVSARIKNGQVGVDNDLEYPPNTGEFIRYLRVTARIIGQYDPGFRHIFNVHISGECRPSYQTIAPMDESLLNP